jgi:hypothetical protein
VSTDGGLTWTERSRVHHVGGSSHLAIGPEAIAVRVTPLSASSNRHDPGVDFIAVSRDDGESWTTRVAPGTRAWSASFDPAEALLRWVEPLAWDSAGALYSLWSEGTSLWLARSTDVGETWTSWQVAADSAPMYFPYLTARGDGELAATWFSGFGEALRAHVAYIRVTDAGQSAPVVLHAAPFEVEAFDESDSGEVRPSAGGEYMAAHFLRDGRIAVVTPIQDPVRDRWGFRFHPWIINRSGS